jgi:hypothetical protein
MSREREKASEYQSLAQTLLPVDTNSHGQWVVRSQAGEKLRNEA